MNAAWHGLWFAVALMASPDLSASTASPAVEQVLRQYEQSMCPLRTFEAQFERIETDDIFGVRTYGRGNVYLDLQRGNWRIELQPGVNVPASNARYTNRPVRPDKCILKDGQIFQYLDPENRHSLPHFLCSPVAGKDVIVSTAHYVGTLENAPWPIRRVTWHLRIEPDILTSPLVVGLTAEQLQQRFTITFNKLSGQNSSLTFLPRTKQDQRHFRSLDVLFAASGVPLATRMHDSTRNKQVLVLFKPESIHINRKLQSGEDPLELELNEFERLLRLPNEQLSAPSPPASKSRKRDGKSVDYPGTGGIKAEFVEP